MALATVSIVDTASFTVADTVATGRGAHGVVIDPSGKHAYITNIYDNSVSVLDLATRQMIATVAVGDAPNGISYSPRVPQPTAAGEIKLTIPHPAGDMPADDQNMHDPQH
jgi:YVTN family beta-propeller protein